MSNYLTEYFRCPEHYASFVLDGEPSRRSGYFRFGEGAICFGRCSRGVPAESPNDALWDGLLATRAESEVIRLPFDLTEVVENLRNERYKFPEGGDAALTTVSARMYYWMRPILPVIIRKYLQRVRLNGWSKLRFPQWPVDRSVDNLMRELMLVMLRAKGVERIPFIWFWPEGSSGCVLMTHDVETKAGRDFCTSLMDLDDQHGIKASFQVIPEERYEVSQSFVDGIWKRGFDVAVHDLNHDGLLFRSHSEFVSRASRINSYRESFRTAGFRSAVLYRKQPWYEHLQFEYDMSVPNVAHLDPQRGGCCTVMPFFIGNMVEIPVTTTQDYTLFHILNDYSLDLWEQQIDLILKNNGLVSFIVHPDYVIEARERKTYEKLLAYLSSLKDKKNLWFPVPSEVNHWWRQRSQMRLVEKDGRLEIEGAGRERARIAYASESNGRLQITLEDSWEGPLVSVKEIESLQN